MTEAKPLNALKHGAFSAILILPGEDPSEYEKLRADVIAEFQVSGPSELAVAEELAVAYWQQRRLYIYERVKMARLKGYYEEYPVDFPSKMKQLIDNLMKDDPKYQAENEKESSPPPPKTVEQSLLELGEMATIEHLDKEIAVRSRLQGVIDRGLKRLLTIKGLKSLMNSTAPPAVIDQKPILELSAEKNQKTSE